MEKCNIKLASGEELNVDVIRYFNLKTGVPNEPKYLVYSKNEKDENGNIVLYIDKLGATPITDEEWSTIKAQTFGAIVNANRSGAPIPVEDLDFNNKILNVKAGKEFKLSQAAYDLLGANKKKFEEVVPVQAEAVPFKEFNNVTSLDELLTNSNINSAPPVSPVPTNNAQAEPFSAPNPVEQIIPSLEEPTITPASIQTSNVTNASAAPSIDYEAMYNASLKQMENLQAELDSYKDKIEKLKEIIG